VVRKCEEVRRCKSVGREHTNLGYRDFLHLDVEVRAFIFLRQVVRDRGYLPRRATYYNGRPAVLGNVEGGCRVAHGEEACKSGHGSGKSGHRGNTIQLERRAV
jgi:hypothetical protein